MSDFMDGYTRGPDVTNRIMAAIHDTLYAHPTQRLGQVIANSLQDTDLFMVHDEVLISALNDYTRERHAH